jgi:signal transduction histidine kinase
MGNWSYSLKRIIEMHKGKVKLIESKKGFTKFRILFPLKF